MNVLFVLDPDFYPYESVMLTSLFENCSCDISVYALYEVSEGRKKQVVEFNSIADNYHVRINWIKIDKKDYDYLLKGKNIIQDRSWYVLAALEYLPKDIHRIIYFNQETIITDNLRELYEYEMGDSIVLAPGEHYRRVNGQYFRNGARAENGEYIDDSFLLFDLGNMKKISFEVFANVVSETQNKKNTFLKKAICTVLGNRILTVDPMIYGFRMDLFERFLNNGCKDLNRWPLLLRCPLSDYHKIGIQIQKQVIRFNTFTQKQMTVIHPERACFELTDYWEMLDKIYITWWKYARKSRYYYILKFNNLIRKPMYLFLGLKLDEPIKTARKYYRHLKSFSELRNITNSDTDLCGVVNKYSYSELEYYINSLPAQEARKTMVDLFKFDCGLINTKKKAIVVFMVYSSSEWQCETLYRILESDSRFEPFIVVCKHANGTKETIENTYRRTMDFFTASKGYNTVCCESIPGEIPKADDIVESADIIFYFNPGTYLRPTEYSYENRKIRQLLVHVPYGFYLVDKTDITHNKKYYDKIIFKMAWFYFCCDTLQIEIVDEQQRMGAYNVRASGLPKLDLLVEKKYEFRKQLWKTSKNGKEKRIIWAPHWLLDGTTGTFDQNYLWFYEFAKEHPETSWVIRPHPRLPYSSSDKYHIFDSLQDYDAYLDRWNELPNATVISDGDYYDIFDSSDAMILDSVSFIAEYQYTGKPLLLLKPQNPGSRGGLGELVEDVIYKSSGDDFNSIERFIKEVVIDGDDTMKPEREKFFGMYLNYKNRNGKTASKYIYDIFVKELFGT